MKIHTYLSSSGKDLIMEYINALTIEEQVDGLAVLAYMEKGEFESREALVATAIENKLMVTTLKDE